jgi:hypothetical protein
MQVGILLYGEYNVGLIRYEASWNDVNQDYFGTSAPGEFCGVLKSYLYYPKPIYTQSRSFFRYDGNPGDYLPYYDGRIPNSVHCNHERELVGRVVHQSRGSAYTRYDLSDGTTAYTTNHNCVSDFYQQYTYSAWTAKDTDNVMGLIKGKNESYDDKYMWYSFDVFMVLLYELWKGLSLILLFLFILGCIGIGIFAFFSNFEIVRRIG